LEAYPSISVELASGRFIGDIKPLAWYVMNNIFSAVQYGENDITTIFINKDYLTLIVEDMFAYLIH
jgi:hypothetical protein